MSFCKRRSKYCRKGRNQDSKKHRNQQVEPGNALCCSSELVVDKLSENHSLSGRYFFLGKKKEAKSAFTPNWSKSKSFQNFPQISCILQEAYKMSVPQQDLAFFPCICYKTRHLASSPSFSLYLQTLSQFRNTQKLQTQPTLRATFAT